TTTEVKLTDFSIASLLPKEIATQNNPNQLEGTLAYISPEQTGRMNRAIDYRSDFYSLGVTFFEILSGSLPFDLVDPIELVYAHIAKQAPPLSHLNPKIPLVLEGIVSKLMAKNAEERYQSALGLKHDLEKCLKLWNKNRNIDTFQLGSEDISQHFVIPEKLYGREAEVKRLLNTFDRVSLGTTEITFIAGFSGVGKTAVVNEVHKPIVQKRGYFIKGKFDQLQRDIPFAGFIQAFEDLIEQILSETDEEIKQWKDQILTALGEQAQVIIDLVPGLEQIIGTQSPVAELSGSAAQNRLNFLFQRFINVFARDTHPLVIFLDDLQWADVTSLQLIKFVISESKEYENKPKISLANVFEDNKNQKENIKSLLLIGAYRDNEVSITHPLHLLIQELLNLEYKIDTIELNPLNQKDLNSLVSDTLRCKKDNAIPLSQMVFSKTKGNAFFIHQFLKHLYKDEVIKFDFEKYNWQCNIAEVRELALTDDVVEFTALQIKRLPKYTQDVLKLAACIGNEFDLRTLAIINQKSEIDTASEFWPALKEGIAFSKNENYKLAQDSQYLSTVDDHIINDKIRYSKDTKDFKHQNKQFATYKFLHDRVQQAAYSLISEEQKKSVHLQLGQLLLKNIPAEEREENIFILVNQFNKAVELICDPAERYGLAKMNLIAGRRALGSTAYVTADNYLNTGINLLTNNSWEIDYDLSLGLHETAAEAKYLSGDFEHTEKYTEIVLFNAKTLLEKVKSYEIKIELYKSRNQGIDAISIGIEVLKSFGVQFPEHPSPQDIGTALQQTQLTLVEKKVEDLVNLPQMTDPKKLAVMNILSRLVPITYACHPLLFPLVALKQVNISINDGNCADSALAYGTYAVLLNYLQGDVESNYKFGQLALNVLDKFNIPEQRCKVLFVVNSFTRHWKEDLEESLNFFLQVYSIALEAGDLEQAAYSLCFYLEYSFWRGKQLTELETKISNYHQQITFLKQEILLLVNKITWQVVLNLLKDTEEAYNLKGDTCDEKIILPILQKASNRQGICYLYIQKLVLCYLFEEYSQACQYAILAKDYLDTVAAKFIISIFYFYDSLAMLAVYPASSELEQSNILEKVAENQAKMKKWADHAPMNFLHKFDLVEAERHRILGNFLDGMDAYERAINQAKENEYINEEALANELAAKFYLECGKQNIARTYLTDAYYAYMRWGAKAKVEHLQQRYPQLITPIIQQEKISQSTTHRSTINNHTDTSISLSERQTHQTLVGSRTSTSDYIDLVSVIKASQALSGKIEREQLLYTLLKVVMENAGASKCVLILNTSEEVKLKVEAVCSGYELENDTIEFLSANLESSQEVPVSLINYIKRTQKILVINNVSTEPSIARDQYIINQQPKSILCLPMLNQGNLVGILYLENILMTDVFSSERIEILKVITTQAAISLENSMLYSSLTKAKENLEEYSHNLEEKVIERTKELIEKNEYLQKTLKELRTTQAQLIQSEKMSSLGQMVAGIAHEINNPINFIHGNINYSCEYVQDLLDLIAVYQQEYPEPTNAVIAKAEQIDLNFLTADFLKILNSMKVGSSRIRNIVLGLRNFSRLDESEKKPVDIHEGIDNTLIILQHKLKANSNTQNIQIVKKYGEIPEICCYPGQLNQVFMNILSNAIDAFDDKYFEIENDYSLLKPEICITSELTDSKLVKIRIADNGIGINKEVQPHIFNPFFTTKPVGSGTGLGLSISYQIIVDKHKGKLTCNSSPGEGTEFLIEIPLR
nr:AAA family ATPase [Mastigocoleus sp. MO_167.B18]